jgi:hypothetical protein
MKEPIPHYSMKDKMVEDIMKDKICDLPTNWGKPAPGGKSAESEKKGEDMYKSNYANPKCKNRENKDCAYGEVNKDGFCKNCAYTPKRSAK